MKKLTFRNLTSEDVECRVCNSTEKKINLLIYKNARVDMAILNDTVGMGWKREHNFKDGKNYCTVSIWDEENKIWISREDCGVESNTEAEKGQSSDAFKRACFNWGIGTELYTGPKISINKEEKDSYNGKVTMTFSISEMTVSENKKITHLVVVDKWGKERFRWDEGQKAFVAPQSSVVETDDRLAYHDTEEPATAPKKAKLSVDDCKAIIAECETAAKASGKYDEKEVGKWAYGKNKWIEEQGGFNGDFKSWLRSNFKSKFAAAVA